MKQLVSLAVCIPMAVVGCGSDSDPAPDASESDTEHDAAADIVADTQSDAGPHDADTTDTAPDADEPALASDVRGPYAAGVALRTWTDASRDRTLPVTIWYPAVGEPTGQLSISTLVAETDQRATYEGLLESAPADCPSRSVAGALDAAPASPATDAWPVIVYSHCHNCLGLSGASIASHLASHGFVVVAPDHVGNTLFDGLDGASMPLNAETLAMRIADLGFVLDTALTGNAELVPDGLVGQLDEGRVGAVGHSFGAVSVSGLAASDDRVDAVVPMGAPPESPLFPGVFLVDIDAPMMLVVLTEDNSITEVGNTLMRDNFAAATSPIWKLELVDAGHWSVSDLCGITDAYLPGCGGDTRQTNPRETFTYLPVAEGLQLAAEWTTRFVRAHVRGEADALAELAAQPPSGVLLEARNQ